MKSARFILVVLAVAAACACVIWLLAPMNRPASRSDRAAVGGNTVAANDAVDGVAASASVAQRPAEPSHSPSPPHESTVAVQEGDSAESEEERLVDEFYAMTDKWIAPVVSDVSMNDVESFARQFRHVPASRKRECLQRALNLIPDENVMLLAGILMDKSQDRELVEMVYSDILNRDADVKKPILQEIFKDRQHPCWADTAWILDVTGELPKKK